MRVPAAAIPTRDQAKQLVLDWCEAYEGLGAGRGKHALEQIRELHLATRAPVRPQEQRSGDPAKGITARGAATRAGSSGSGIPIRDVSPYVDRAFRILRHVHNVDPEYWKTLYLWGLGYSLRDQARIRKRSKSTVQIWFEGGIALVMGAMISGQFR